MTTPSEPGQPGNPNPVEQQHRSTPSPPAASESADDAGWGQAPQPSGYSGEDYGQYGTPSATAHTVDQPGIVPLRPLSLGEIYDGAIKAIRSNPGVMFGFSAIAVVISTTLQAVALWGFYEDLNAFYGLVEPTMDDIDALYETLASLVIPLAASTLASFVVATILTGLLIHSVSQSVIGRRLPVAQLWALVRPQLLSLLGLTLIITVAMLAAVAVSLLPMVALIGANADELLVAIAALMGTVAAVCAMMFVVFATVLATPALVLERTTVMVALRRSWQLTRPTFWRVVGIYLLTSVLVGVISSVVTSPVVTLTSMIGLTTGTTIAQLAASTIATTLTTPFLAAVIALLYIDIRIRNEGLDIELSAAAASES
ncbi:MAG: hypothetical protein ACK5KU_02770 [Beutenbergiaceae bacterium]